MPGQSVTLASSAGGPSGPRSGVHRSVRHGKDGGIGQQRDASPGLHRVDCVAAWAGLACTGIGSSECVGNGTARHPHRGRFSVGRQDRHGRNSGVEEVAPWRRHQGGQPPVHRPPHGHDNSAFHGGVSARCDGTGSGLCRPFRAIRWVGKSGIAGLRHPRPCHRVRSLRARPGERPEGRDRRGTDRHRPGHLAVARGHSEQGRCQRSRVDAQLGQLYQRRHSRQAGDRRLSAGACTRHERHPDPGRHSAGRRPVLQRRFARAREHAAIRTRFRIGAPGSPASARRPGHGLVH